jgi:hypothetical protein
MAKSKAKTPVPAKSFDELVAYFDTHDLGDDWALMPHAQFDIDIQRRTHFVASVGSGPSRDFNHE